MTLRLATVTAALLVSACGLRGPTAPALETAEAKGAAVCDPERLACFTSRAVVTSGQGWVTAQSVVVSEDLPTAGYHNRWHYLLDKGARPAIGRLQGLGPIWAQVCGAAMPHGMVMEAIGYWALDLTPVDMGVREEFAALVPASECRYQAFTVTSRPGGGYEIMVEEPFASQS